MSFGFKSLANTDQDIYGHNDTKDGNPAGGYAGDGYSDHCQDIFHNPENPVHFAIRWQDGPVDRDAGEKPNGAFVEDILEVCRIRLEFYQDSPFACEENAEAAAAVKMAVRALVARRQDRSARGVEGKHEA